MTIPILERFYQERRTALAAEDPMAPLLALATVNAHGHPQVRTLVLREVQERLAIFMNGSSPKWAALQHQPRLSFVTYWPSSALQYRFDCTTDPIDRALVQESWLLRPESPKRVDHLYEEHAAQSETLANREQLLNLAAGLPEDVLQRPTEQAMGLFLVPQRIERLNLNMEGAPHDRRCYCSTNDWREEVLMP